jgi:hypothetical protein
MNKSDYQAEYIKFLESALDSSLKLNQALINRETTAPGLSDDKVKELANKYLTYIAYDEGDGYGDVEIVGELEFYDAIVNELNKKASEE